MNRKLLVALFALQMIALLPVSAHAKLAFGILPWDGEQKLSQAEVAKVEAKFAHTLNECGKFTIVERSQVEKLMSEQAFQISGAVGGNQAEKLGKILSVDKLVQFTVIPESGGDHSGIIRVFDVATGAQEINETESSSGTQDADDVARNMAGHLILKYPLMGRVGKVAGQTIIVDVGADGKLKEGDRLFVARREIERDGSGEVIFEDYARVGILRIERAGKQGSKAKIDSLVDLGNTVKVGDLVSPAPIPERPPVVYTSPKLADYVGGDVIVQDDYSGERMVGVNNNREDAYQSGQLVLDATHKDNGHAYGFYPNSLSSTDFILEFEMEWLTKDTDRLNRLAVSLRSNGDYLEENSYVVKFYQDNTYDFFAWVDGHRKWIQENTTSIGMEVDDGDENMVRIVAVGPDVELYLNDKFIAGFTDERFDHGVVGLAVTQGCKVGVDDLVMRKPVKKAGE